LLLLVVAVVVGQLGQVVAVEQVDLELALL
jgi:hypothetical protein